MKLRGILFANACLCRNRSAELLYGYSAEEALGQDAIELLTDTRDFDVAYDIVHRIKMGERWTGQFPAKTKTGERVLVVATNTPFYDDDGTLVGIVCVSTDSRPFQETRAALWDTKNSDTDSNINRPRNTVTAKLGLDSQQPLQATIASKISNLVSFAFGFCTFCFRLAYFDCGTIKSRPPR